MDSLKVKTLTNVYCGAFTPSIDSSGKYLFFSAYESNGWDIYRITDPQEKLLDTLPKLTEYMKKLEDSSYTYIRKRSIPLFYSDTLDASEVKDVVSDSSGLANLATTNVSSDSLFSKDSVALIVSRDSLERTQDSLLADSLEWEEDRQRAGLNGFGGLSAYDRQMELERVSRRKRKYMVDTSAFLWDSTKIMQPDGKYIKYSYSPVFSVDALSLAVGGGVSGNGYVVGGQTFISLSDIMADHRIMLYANLNAYNNFDNSEFYFSYGYLPNRVDVYGTVSRYKRYNLLENSDTRFTYNDDAVYNVSTNLSYPFSKFMRTDLLLGLDYVSRAKRENVVENDIVISELEAQYSSYYNFESGLHLSFDNTLWGATGPINGQRLSILGMAVPPAGPTDYSFALLKGDFRKYFRFFKKYTFATRLSAGTSSGLFSKRNPFRFYLGGSPGDLRYFFNYWSSYAGSDGNSFTSIVAPLRGYMLGQAYSDEDGYGIGKTNYALANLELRFPFIYNISLMFPLPINISYIMGALFWDLGAGFDNIDDFDPTYSNGDFKDIRSGLGFGLRMNLFGMMIVRWDRAWGSGGDGQKIDYFSIGTEF